MSEDRAVYGAGECPDQMNVPSGGVPAEADALCQQAVELNYELRRRLDAAKDTIRRYSECLDGFGPVVGDRMPGVEGARTPEELRKAFEMVVGALQGTWAALEDEREKPDYPADLPDTPPPPRTAGSIDEVLSRKRSMITRRMEMFSRELNRDLNDMIVAYRSAPEDVEGEKLRSIYARAERMRAALDRVCSLLEGMPGQQIRDYAEAIREQGGIDSDGAVVDADAGG